MSTEPRRRLILKAAGLVHLNTMLAQHKRADGTPKSSLGDSTSPTGLGPSAGPGSGGGGDGGGDAAPVQAAPSASRQLLNDYLKDTGQAPRSDLSSGSATSPTGLNPRTGTEARDQFAEDLHDIGYRQKQRNSKTLASGNALVEQSRGLQADNNAHLQRQADIAAGKPVAPYQGPKAAPVTPEQRVQESQSLADAAARSKRDYEAKFGKGAEPAVSEREVAQRSQTPHLYTTTADQDLRVAPQSPAAAPSATPSQQATPPVAAKPANTNPMDGSDWATNWDPSRQYTSEMQNWRTQGGQPAFGNEFGTPEYYAEAKKYRDQEIAEIEKREQAAQQIPPTGPQTRYEGMSRDEVLTDLKKQRAAANKSPDRVPVAMQGTENSATHLKNYRATKEEAKEFASDGTRAGRAYTDTPRSQTAKPASQPASQPPIPPPISPHAFGTPEYYADAAAARNADLEANPQTETGRPITQQPFGTDAYRSEMQAARNADLYRKGLPQDGATPATTARPSGEGDPRQGQVSNMRYQAPKQNSMFKEFFFGKNKDVEAASQRTAEPITRRLADGREIQLERVPYETYSKTAPQTKTTLLDRFDRLWNGAKPQDRQQLVNQDGYATFAPGGWAKHLQRYNRADNTFREGAANHAQDFVVDSAISAATGPVAGAAGGLAATGTRAVANTVVPQAVKRYTPAAVKQLGAGAANFGTSTAVETVLGDEISTGVKNFSKGTPNMTNGQRVKESREVLRALLCVDTRFDKAAGARTDVFKGLLSAGMNAFKGVPAAAKNVGKHTKEILEYNARRSAPSPRIPPGGSPTQMVGQPPAKQITGFGGGTSKPAPAAAAAPATPPPQPVKAPVTPPPSPNAAAPVTPPPSPTASQPTAGYSRVRSQTIIPGNTVTPPAKTPEGVRRMQNTTVQPQTTPPSATPTAPAGAQPVTPAAEGAARGGGIWKPWMTPVASTGGSIGAFLGVERAANAYDTHITKPNSQAKADEWLAQLRNSLPPERHADLDADFQHVKEQMQAMHNFDVMDPAQEKELNTATIRRLKTMYGDQPLPTADGAGGGDPAAPAPGAPAGAPAPGAPAAPAAPQSFIPQTGDPNVDAQFQQTFTAVETQLAEIAKMPEGPEKQARVAESLNTLKGAGEQAYGQAIQNDPALAQKMEQQFSEHIQTKLADPALKGEVDESLNTGKATPGIMDNAAKTLSQFISDPSSILSFLGNMQLPELLMLGLGVGLAGIGMFNAMSGEAGPGTMLMGLLGGGLAIGGGALAANRQQNDPGIKDPGLTSVPGAVAALAVQSPEFAGMNKFMVSNWPMIKNIPFLRDQMRAKLEQQVKTTGRGLVTLSPEQLDQALDAMYLHTQKPAPAKPAPAAKGEGGGWFGGLFGGAKA